MTEARNHFICMGPHKSMNFIHTISEKFKKLAILIVIFDLCFLQTTISLIIYTSQIDSAFQSICMQMCHRTLSGRLEHQQFLAIQSQCTKSTNTSRRFQITHVTPNSTYLTWYLQDFTFVNYSTPTLPIQLTSLGTLGLYLCQLFNSHLIHYQVFSFQLTYQDFHYQVLNFQLRIFTTKRSTFN